jgi:hypothetical protein
MFSYSNSIKQNTPLFFAYFIRQTKKYWIGLCLFYPKKIFTPTKKDIPPFVPSFIWEHTTGFYIVTSQKVLHYSITSFIWKNNTAFFS